MTRHSMRSKTQLAGVALFIVSMAGSAWANEPERGPVADRSTTGQVPASGRYVMNAVEGGFLRMDTDTGVVSLCARKAGTWACETVPDDYKALQKDTDRLTQENATLKRELAEARRETGQPPRAERKLELPSEQDIDKAIGQIEKYMKKFKDLIERHSGSGEAPGRI